jgi:hypothetical protein
MRPHCFLLLSLLGSVSCAQSGSLSASGAHPGVRDALATHFGIGRSRNSQVAIGKLRHLCSKGVAEACLYACERGSLQCPPPDDDARCPARRHMELKVKQKDAVLIDCVRAHVRLSDSVVEISARLLVDHTGLIIAADTHPALENTALGSCVLDELKTATFAPMNAGSLCLFTITLQKPTIPPPSSKP